MYSQWNTIHAVKVRLLSFVTKSMESEVIILCEISQTQKEKYCMISLIWESRKVDLMEIELELQLATEAEAGEG